MALQLNESHPPEDLQTTALLVQCILKSAAVLRVVCDVGQGGGPEEECIAGVVC